MKAFLLAAGLGTRLRPLTDKIPKCLLPINGKPLLDIWLDHLVQSGVDHVLINTHHLAEQVEAFVKNRRRAPSLRLEHEKELLGSGGTIYRFRELVDGEDAFWVIYGDNLSAVNLREMLEQHGRNEQMATIGLFKAANPKACGIATLDTAGRVVSFEEKPALPKGNWANAGIYLLNTDIFEAVKWDFPSPIDFGYHILPQLVGRMQGYCMQGFHMDIGTPENYEEAQSAWRKAQSA